MAREIPGLRNISVGGASRQVFGPLGAQSAAPSFKTPKVGSMVQATKPKKKVKKPTGQNIYRMFGRQPEQEDLLTRMQQGVRVERNPITGEMELRGSLTAQDIQAAMTADWQTQQQAASELAARQERGLEQYQQAARVPVARLRQVASDAERSGEMAGEREAAGLAETSPIMQAAMQLGTQAEQRRSEALTSLEQQRGEAISGFQDNTALSIQQSREGIEQSFQSQKQSLISQYGNDKEGLQVALNRLGSQKLQALGSVATQSRLAYNEARLENQKFWAQTESTLRQAEDQLAGLAQRGGADVATSVAQLNQSIRANRVAEQRLAQRNRASLETTAAQFEASGMKDVGSYLRSMEAHYLPLAPLLADLFEMQQLSIEEADIGGGRGGESDTARNAMREDYITEAAAKMYGGGLPQTYWEREAVRARRAREAKQSAPRHLQKGSIGPGDEKGFKGSIGPGPEKPFKGIIGPGPEKPFKGIIGP